MGGDGARARQGRGAPRERQPWRWLLLIYLCGTIGDLSWHLHRDLTTGDRVVESYEVVTGAQASLFWPVDLLAQAFFAPR